MEHNKAIKIIYSIFLGLLIALFIGLGINTFYPGPKEPSYPTETSYTKDVPTEEQAAKQNEYNDAYAKYNEEFKVYSRNVSVIALICAVILLVVSLIYEKKIRVLADGILVGGLFTLIYSIIRGFMSEDTKMTFVTVSIGLLVVLYLGYHKFVRAAVQKKPAQKV